MYKLYSVNDICKYLSIGRNTAYELIKQDKLKAKKVGRAYKITENALNEFVKTLEA